MFGNLLNQALSVIPKQNFVYYKFKEFTVNELGIKEPVYEDGISLQGSVQAVSQDMYEKLGLDWSKKYISIHCSKDIRNVDSSQVSPDKVEWDGKKYLVIRVSNWFKQDGWNKIVAVEDMPEEPEEEQEEQNGD